MLYNISQVFDNEEVSNRERDRFLLWSKTHKGVCVGGGYHEIYRPVASTGLKSSADLSLSVSLQTKHPFWEKARLFE